MQGFRLFEEFRIIESHIDESHIDEGHIDESHIDESHIDESHIDENHIEIKSMKNISLFFLALCLLLAGKLAPPSELEPGFQVERFDLGRHVEDVANPEVKKPALKRVDK